MKKKGVTLAVSVVCIGCLFGAYVLLKTHNARTEKEKEAAANKPILELDTENPASLSFDIGEETIEFVYTDGSWSRTDDETFPVNGDAIEEVLTDLSKVSAVRILEDVEDTSEYGFEDPQNVFTYTDTEGTVTTVTIGANNESTGDDYLLVDNGEERVYTISTTLRSSVSADIYDYASGEELPDIREEDVMAVTVEKPEGCYKIYKEGTTWYVEAEDGEILSADEDTVESEISGLSYSLGYSDFLEHNCTDASGYGIDENSILFTILYRVGDVGEEEDETGKNGTDTEETADVGSEAATGNTKEAQASQELTFRIGTTDAFGNYYVQKDGSKEVHTISSSVLEAFLNGSSGNWEETEAETESVSETEEGKETENSTEKTA